MNYLFTAAGKGSRFIKNGIKPPKPLIKVFGDELLIWSIRSFTFEDNDNLYIVTQLDHRCKKTLEKKIKRLFFNLNVYWLELEYLPNGQLLTAITAIKNFKLEGPLVIHNCDTSFEMNMKDINNLLKNNNKTYAYFPVFKADGNHWSFAETERNSNLVVNIKEKERISNNCSIGTYIFNSASQMVDDAMKYTKEHKPNKNLGEYYIAPFLNHMVQKAKEIIITSAKNPKLYGTVEELIHSFQISYNELISENAWLGNQRKTLVVDIDGTLCYPNKKGDYSKCKPIESVVNKLRIENDKGTYIILFTARNMRTFRGAIGLINKYTAPLLLEWLKKNDVPYDEIIYGKPWGFGGVSYADDKNVEPENI